MNDLISVIVPVYNVETYLEQCVNSIINQTYTNLEIILVDDGSTDNSGRICDKYAAMDSRIKVVHKINAGVSAARNLGLDIANGKYITFVDSDDFVEDMYCSQLISFMRDDVSMVVLGLKRLKGDGTFKALSHRLKSGYYHFDELKDKIIDDGTASGFTFHSSCSILYRKELIERNTLFFDYEIKYNEDGLFNTLYFMLSQKGAYINYSITPYVYRNNFCSATHTIDITSQVYKKNMQLIEEKLQTISSNFNNLSIQLKRRSVTLFLAEAVYAIKKKKVRYNAFIELVKKYNVDKNVSTLCFPIMKKNKYIFFALLKLRFYFIIYYIIKNKRYV